MQEYIEEVKSDLYDTIKESASAWAEIEPENLRDAVNDPRSTDSVTGNATGSYYCNAYKAAETINARGVLFDSDFLQRLEDLGTNAGEILNKGAEAVDVWARCIALDMIDDEELEKIRADAITDELEDLRRELRAEKISQYELAELQALAPWIMEHGDEELAEAAGISEEEWNARRA